MLNLARPETVRAFVRVGVIGLLALLAALFYWRLTLQDGALFWGPPLLQYFPWRTFAVEEYLSGRLPLWNPYAGFGAPLAANPQSGVFYPLNLWYLFLPFARAMSVTVVVHVFLIGAFMYGFLRLSGLSRTGSFLGGVVLMFSGYVTARAGFLDMTTTVAWLPALLFALAGHRQAVADASPHRRLLWLAAIAGATGMLLLAGHLQLAYYSLIAAGLYFLGRLIPTLRVDWLAALKVMLRVGLATAVGVGLAAIQLLPALELMQESVLIRYAPLEEATPWTLGPGQLLSALAPDFYGDPAAGDWWGAGAYGEGVIYAGLLPLLLAALAVGFRFKQARFYMALGILALLLALGRDSFLFPWLLEHLPGATLFLTPVRFGLWYTLALAALAALGCDALSDAAHPARGRGLGIAAVVLGAGIALTAMVMTALPFGLGALPVVPALAGAGRWLLAAGVLLTLRRWMPGFLWQGAAIGLVLANLFLFGNSLNPTTDPSLYRAPEPEPVAQLREAAGLGRVFTPEQSYQRSVDALFRLKGTGVTDWQELYQLREAAVPNLSTRSGLHEVYNNDPLRLSRARQVEQAVVAADFPPPALDALGVRYVIAASAPPGMRPRGDLGAATLYERRLSLPRAFVVSQNQVVAGTAGALDLMLSPSFDPRRSAAVEAPTRAALFTGGPIGTARITHYSTQRVTVEVASSGGLLVLADAYYPGWRALVDGSDATIYPANAAFRGVPVAPGNHTVEFIYDPATVKTGAAVSALSLILLLGVTLWSFRYQRPRARLLS